MSETVLSIIMSAIDKFSSTFDYFEKRIKTSEKKMNDMLDKVNFKYHTFGRRINALGQGLEELGRSGKGFMGIGFGALFTGMAIERFFGSALRSIFNTYVKIIDVSDKFFQKTQHLRAGWEFLKFALIDALSQNELFISLIDFLIQAVNFLGEFINKHPALAIFILTFFSISYAIGAVLVPLGMFVLLMSSLGFTALPVFFIILAVIIILSLIFTILTDKTDTVIKNLGILVVVLISLTLLAALFGLIFVSPWMIIILLISALLIILGMFWDDFIAGAQKIWIVMKIVALGIKLVFFEMINAIIKKFADMFNYIVDFLPEKVKKAFGIQPINAVQFDTSEIRNRISELKAEGASIEAARESARSETQKVSIKDGIKEGLKDMMPDFSTAIKDGIVDSRSDIYPSTYE